MNRPRTELPPRRLAFTYDIDHGGRRWLLTLGFDRDGQVKELFLNALPSGDENDQLEEIYAHKACIAFSHALQCGASVDDIAGYDWLTPLFNQVFALAVDAERRDGAIAREVQTFVETRCQVAAPTGG